MGSIKIKIVNPELVFTDVFYHLWDTKTRYIVNYGGTGCFAPDQLVMTDKGSKPIGEVSVGDMVLSYNERTNQTEYKKVDDTFKYKNDSPLIEIILKNGHKIVCTEDHKIMYGGSWVKAKDIVSLWNARALENRKGGK